MMRRNSKAPAASASTSDNSTDSSNSPEHLLTKKRKPTYLVRKEEEKTLRDEILQLEAQVAVLNTQGMPAGSAVAVDPGIQQAKAKSKLLNDAMKQQQLGVAAAQSLMAECMRTQYSNPLCTRICLKEDWGERRSTMLAIREEKLRNAYEYVMTRTRVAPEGQNQILSELVETDNGDICSLGSTVIRFPGVRSLRQVFEALWFYLTNMEISISERLGHITVREDYDMIEGAAYNSRILSSDNNGITTESNAIVFGQFFEKGDPRFGGEPCAIVASDCVDEDELYPYRPSQNIRKDISGAVVMTADRRHSRRWSYKTVKTMTSRGVGGHDAACRLLNIHRPEFSISPLARQELEAGISEWGKVMIKTMRDVLYART